ncbi:hypothetical protein BD779DRAFT_1412500, partial [Infundibulicybe gibba]
VVSILHILAIGSTVFRLWQRYTSQRLWHDDYIALLAVITDCVFFVVLHVWTRRTTITFYWISAVCFLLVSWCVVTASPSLLLSARVSLALAIARIFPPGRAIRRFTIGMAWAFGLLGTLNTLGIIISCGCNTSWHNSPQVQCDLPKAMSTAAFCANVISDALLVFTPLRMLWQVKLPDEQRRLILGGFAASIWTSVAAGVCFVFLSGPDSWGVSRRIMLFLASVSLMVCNSMVIVTFVYRLVRS